MSVLLHIALGSFEEDGMLNGVCLCALAISRSIMYSRTCTTVMVYRMFEGAPLVSCGSVRF